MSKNNDSAGTILSFIIFTLFSLGGFFTTIMSGAYSFYAYQHINYAGMVIWLILGLFMLYWCIYFSRELFQLIKSS